jgi:hypothetical protein
MPRYYDEPDIPLPKQPGNHENFAGHNSVGAALGIRTPRMYTENTVPGLRFNAARTGYYGNFRLTDRANTDVLNAIDKTSRKLNKSFDTENDFDRDLDPPLTREEFEARREGYDIEFHENMTGVELESLKEAELYRSIGDLAVQRSGSGLSYALSNLYYSFIEGVSSMASNPAIIPTILAMPFTGALSLKMMGVKSLAGASISTRAGAIAIQSALEGGVEATSVATIQHHLEMKNPDSDFDRVEEAFFAGISAAGGVAVFEGLGQAIGAGYRSVRGTRVRNGETFVDADTRLGEADAQTEEFYHEQNALTMHEDTPQEAADVAGEVQKIRSDPEQIELAKQQAAASKEKDPAAGKEETARGSADAPQPQADVDKTIEDFLPNADKADVELEGSNVKIEYTEKGGKSSTTIELGLPNKLAKKVWAAAGDQRKVATKNHAVDILTALDEAGVLPKTKENLQIVKKAAKEFRAETEAAAKAAAKIGGKSIDGKTIETSPLPYLHKAIEDAKVRRATDAAEDFSVDGGAAASDAVVHVAKPTEVNMPEVAYEIGNRAARTTNLDTGASISNLFELVTTELSQLGKVMDDVLDEDALLDVEVKVDELFAYADEDVTQIMSDIDFQHRMSDVSEAITEGIEKDIRRELDAIKEAYIKSMDGVNQRLRDTTVVDPQKNIIDVEATHGGETTRIKTKHEESTDEMVSKGLIDEEQAVKAKAGAKDLDESLANASQCKGKV